MLLPRRRHCVPGVRTGGGRLSYACVQSVQPRVPPVLPVTAAPPGPMGDRFCPGCPHVSQHEPDKDEPHEYEALRLGNISKYSSILATLGIASAASKMRVPPESKPRYTPKRRHSPEGPDRRSTRGKTADGRLPIGDHCHQSPSYPAPAYLRCSPNPPPAPPPPPHAPPVDHSGELSSVDPFDWNQE